MSVDLNVECEDACSTYLCPPLAQSNLISRAQAGDGQAFNALIEPHLHRIYLTAMRITRNHEDAEDACQESIMKAFVHIQTFQGNAQFSTWLTRIVINESLMAIRRLRTEARHRISEDDLCEMPLLLGIKDQSTISDPEALCVRGERNALLWEAIDQLETKSRLAVCQLGLEERETREIAAESHLSRSGVRSRLQRALRKLHAMLAHKLGYRSEQIEGLA
jgi:RNA polymerase sigma-70 factor, ECF subfamily